MKKILAILSILVFLPFSAYALQVLHDDAMDQVTGQAGITIETDLTINLDIGAVSWIDADGVSTYNGTGVLLFAPMNIGTIGVVTDTFSAGIDIDVGSDPSDVYYGTYGVLGAGMPFLRIGITDLNLQIAGIETDFSGPVQIDTVDIMSIDGYIDIGGIWGVEEADNSASMQSVGLAINMGLSIGTLNLGTVSWTDNDGKRLDNPGTGTPDANDNAGAVGIPSLFVGLVGVSGEITIECATDTSRVDGSETFLEIELNNLNVTTGAVSITLALGSSHNALNEVLGTLSVGVLDMTINGDVDISAH